MKKFLLLDLVAIVAVLFTACKPEIHYLAGCDGIYIETKHGRLYGVESNGAIRLKPEWDDIGYGDLDGRIYQAWKGKTVILFDCYGRVLCDSIPIVGDDREEIQQSSTVSGAGLPPIIIFSLVHTQKGVFALMYNQDKAAWYQYGPFADYRGGATGYMFKDNATGKWGVGKYGVWTEVENLYLHQMIPMFTYERSLVMIKPQYERIICVEHEGWGSESDYRNSAMENKVRWYAFDGSKWLSFDYYGKPIKVNNQELSMARRLKPHQGKIKRDAIYNRAVTQRIGTEEASWVIVRNNKRLYY